MLKIFITTTIVLLSLCGYAQFSLSGTVTDKQTGEGLVGANIIINEAHTNAVTDATGHFSITNLSSGNYTVQVSFIGYTTHRQQLELKENTIVKIALQPGSVISDEVVVSATRATGKTPTTFTDLSRQEIQRQNFGQDVPMLLNWTPSVVTTSDAGAGIGYTGMRIRGSDATRINVTINGIPYNDSESLGTFWVNIPDIASTSQSIQIQRGVGTSTNGSGAFGATINLQTNTLNEKPYAELINSIGSFNTRRHTLGFGTGLLKEHWSLEGRVSRIESDGFYFSAGYYSDKTMVKGIVFGGKERTYQAWYGVPESKLNNDREAMEGTALNEGWNEIQTANLLNSNARTFNPYLYQNQIDNYQQDHFQLHFSHQFSPSVTWNTALHYTPGKGYYEEYRYDDAFENYGIQNPIIGNDTITSTDLVRRRWLDNDFYGLTWSLNYDNGPLNLIWGGGWNRYDGDHFGEIIWASVAPVPQGHRYYFNNGDKRDFNTFVKTNYALSSDVNAFIDLQIRTINYNAGGVENNQREFSVDADYAFFNPKFGFTWALSDQQQLYASYAIASREPVRDDFVDSPGKNPKAEKLQNLELGVRMEGTRHVLHANYFLMSYKDQLVLTGQVNDVGAYIRTNAGESYRSGIELDGSLKVLEKLQWSANLTLSTNKIRSYTEILEDYGNNFDEFNVIENVYRDTDISFSPNIIAGSQLSYMPFAGAELTLLSKYVGKQYLDNTSNEQRKINPYFVNDLRVAYSWKPEFMREIVFSFLVNNIFDVMYESNGYTWGYLAGSTAYRENYYYPQAGRNFMAMLALKI
jgi:iron complex outermembrane recepter protein